MTARAQGAVGLYAEQRDIFRTRFSAVREEEKEPRETKRINEMTRTYNKKIKKNKIFPTHCTAY